MRQIPTGVDFGAFVAPISVASSTVRNEIVFAAVRVWPRLASISIDREGNFARMVMYGAHKDIELVRELPARGAEVFLSIGVQFLDADLKFDPTLIHTMAFSPRSNYIEARARCSGARPLTRRRAANN